MRLGLGLGYLPVLVPYVHFCTIRYAIGNRTACAWLFGFHGRLVRTISSVTLPITARRPPSSCRCPMLKAASRVDAYGRPGTRHSLCLAIPPLQTNAKVTHAQTTSELSNLEFALRNLVETQLAVSLDSTATPNGDWRVAHEHKTGDGRCLSVGWQRQSLSDF